MAHSRREIVPEKDPPVGPRHPDLECVHGRREPDMHLHGVVPAEARARIDLPSLLGAIRVKYSDMSPRYRQSPLIHGADRDPSPPEARRH